MTHVVTTVERAAYRSRLDCCLRRSDIRLGLGSRGKVSDLTTENSRMRNAEFGMRTADEFGLAGDLRRCRASIRNPQTAIRNRPPAFSLVEMLVVIGIIVIILSVVLMVGQGALNDAKVKDNRVMLEQLNTAISVYSQNNPFASIKAVKKRYGPYPPDDLMAFTLFPTHGKSGTSIGIPDLMPGGVGQFVKASAPTEKCGPRPVKTSPA